MQAFHCVHDFFHIIGLFTRGEVISHAEGEFWFRHAHERIAKGNICAVIMCALTYKSPRQRTINSNMRLAGTACSGDFPPK